MSECDNTDCIMETIELKDAHDRIKALEEVVELAKRHLSSIEGCPEICENCSGVMREILKKLEEV